MNITFLDEIMTTLITMSRIKKYVIPQTKEEEEEGFKPRAQMNLLVGGSFGSGKSSVIGKRLKEKYEDRTILLNDFTRPALEGSIGKDRIYIPPLVADWGGKMVVIDEWNCVSYSGKDSLLSMLENQSWSKGLGFKVTDPYKYIDPNGFGYAKIIKNRIEGKMKFSCIALAMDFKILGQKDKALLSRFSPIFMDTPIEFMKALTLGQFKVNMNDYNEGVESIKITKECYEEFHKAYWGNILEKNVVSEDSGETGYLTRILHDVLRMGLMNYLRFHKGKRQEKDLIISDSTRLIEMIKWTETLFKQYMTPVTNTRYGEYIILKQKNPFLSIQEYADILGVSDRSIQRYEKIRQKQKDKFVSKDDLGGNRWT